MGGDFYGCYHRAGVGMGVEGDEVVSCIRDLSCMYVGTWLLDNVSVVFHSPNWLTKSG